jgi:hypothetical protein
VIPFSKKIVLILLEGVALRATISSISNYKCVEFRGNQRLSGSGTLLLGDVFLLNPPNLF